MHPRTAKTTGSKRQRMLTAPDNREPLSLDYPELAPIAQVLRQLILNHRLRQKRAVSEPVAQADEAEEVPAELPSERIHQTPWTVTTGS